MKTQTKRLMRVIQYLSILVLAGGIQYSVAGAHLSARVPVAPTTPVTVEDILQLPQQTPPTAVAVRQEDIPQPSPTPAQATPAPDTSSPQYHRALRLQKRIANRFGFLLGTSEIVHGLEQQDALMNRSITVSLQSSDHRSIPSWSVSAQTSPQWIQIDVSPLHLSYTLSPALIAEDLRSNPPVGITYPVNATLLSIEKDDDQVLRAHTEGIAKTGDDFDPSRVALTLVTALAGTQTGITIDIHPLAGRIANATGEDLGNLELLSTGHSDFEGSGVGRKSNVRKGINKYLHNTFVPAQEDFGINSVLIHVPTSEWELALGIFNGGDLRMIPGGGLCQVATTLYRAALNAGFPITKRANHSLFVHYYEKYGVGIDATIFPGRQDLAFRNDTGHPLLIQAYTEGDEAFVNVYGTPDGRVAKMKGPYFSANALTSSLLDGKKIHSNEIAWVQEIHFADGSVQANPVISRYKSIPRSVVKEYLHAAADAEPVVE